MGILAGWKHHFTANWEKMKTAILVSTIGSQTLSQAQWEPVKYCAFGSPGFSLDQLERSVLSQHTTARLSLHHKVNQSEISLSQRNLAYSSLKLIRSKLKMPKAFTWESRCKQKLMCPTKLVSKFIILKE